jgi:hypothetical protein
MTEDKSPDHGYVPPKTDGRRNGNGQRGQAAVAAPSEPPEMYRQNAMRTPPHTAADREPVHEGAHVPERRRRRRSSLVSEDKFFIPPGEIPDGSSYEWKRETVLGREDPFYIASMREQGWEPVDPKMHPNWLPPGYTGNAIRREGMILMERPIELTQEAQAEQRTLARKQVREAEQRLGKTPDGTMTREHPDVVPRVDKQWVRSISIED